MLLPVPVLLPVILTYRSTGGSLPGRTGETGRGCFHSDQGISGSAVLPPGPQPWECPALSWRWSESGSAEGSQTASGTEGTPNTVFQQSLKKTHDINTRDVSTQIKDTHNAHTNTMHCYETDIKPYKSARVPW